MFTFTESLKALVKRSPTGAFHQIRPIGYHKKPVEVRTSHVRRYQRLRLSYRVRIVSPDPMLFLGRFWTRPPGSYTFQRHSHHAYLIDGKFYWNTDILSPSAGQAVFWERRPTDPGFEYEMVQYSLISIRTVDGKQHSFRSSRVYRINKNGLLSIWNSIPGSPGTVGAEVADMAFQTETQYLAGYQCHPFPMMNESGANRLNLDVHKTLRSFSFYHCVHHRHHGLSIQYDWYNPARGEVTLPIMNS